MATLDAGRGGSMAGRMVAWLLLPPSLRAHSACGLGGGLGRALDKPYGRPAAWET